MTAARPMSVSRVRQVIPILAVPDVAATAAFYVERLGFEKQFEVGEPPGYAVVHRDGQIVHFRTGEVPANNSAALYIWVDGLDRSYRECLDRQVSIAYPPRAQPYGMREFAVRDLNGIEVTFAEEVD